MKKKVLLLVISVIIVIIVLTTNTYALYYRTVTSQQDESYTTGILDIIIENEEEGFGEVLNLSNTVPISDSEGSNTTPYKVKITNIGNLSYKFDLKLISTTQSNEIDNDYIKIKIDTNEPVVLSSLTNSIIESDLVLDPEESRIITVRIWLDENTPNNQMNKNFNAKITADGVGE